MSDPIEAMQQMVETMIAEVRTAEPGVVVSYNPATNRAVVRPAMPKRMADGTSLEAPAIHEVPVMWPVGSGGGANGVSFTFPIKPGDGVMLTYQQRSIDGWAAGNNGAPQDPRQYDVNDAVAIPGLRSQDVSPHPTDVELRFGQSVLRMAPSGAVELVSANGQRLQMQSNGTTTVMSAGGTLTLNPDGTATYSGGVITTDSDIVVNGISFLNHRHTGVQTGGGNTGGPIA